MVLNPIIIWATGAPIGVNVLNGAVILALMSVPIIMSMGHRSVTGRRNAGPRTGPASA